MCDNPFKGTARPEAMTSNNRLRITKWNFAKKGDNTGWHKHPVDYVVVPLFDGVLDIDVGGGKMTKADLKNGVPYFREAGVEHDVLNGNDFACAFVEIELLEQARELPIKT